MHIEHTQRTPGRLLPVVLTWCSPTRNAAPWRRLGDFVLREAYTFELDAPTGASLSGFRRVREYEWYVRDGTAVRSPVGVDGVGIDDGTRRRYEQSWLREEERRRAGLDRGDPEPRFITDFFYFLEWGVGAGQLLLRRSRNRGKPRRGPDRVLPDRSLPGGGRRTDQSGGCAPRW